MTTPTLYVQRLAFTVEREDVVRLFGRYGTVSSAKVVTASGRKTGLVAMASHAEAAAALAALDGHPYIGHVLAVGWLDAPAAARTRSAGPCGATDQPLPGGFGDRGGEGSGGAQFFVSEEPLNRPPPFRMADWGPFEPLAGRVTALSLQPPRAAGS